MLTETLTLGYPEKALQMLSEGTAYRDGGVVRETASGRIVALLFDGDAPVQDLVLSNIVPLAIFGISSAAAARRFDKLEAELRAIKDKLADAQAGVDLANTTTDGQLLGRLIGAMHACHFELEAGRRDRLPEYRQIFLEAYHQFKITSDGLVRRPDLLRRFEPVASRYLQAMFLAGVAARDVSYRMGDEAGASELAGMLQRDAEALSTLTRQVLDAPSALFWRTPEHVKLALVTRESHARLKSHEDMLKLLSKEEILRLIAREAENRDTTHD